MKTIDLKKMQMISVVWGLLLFLIVAGLTAIGIVYKKESKEYMNFESIIATASKDYIEKKGFYPENDSITIKTEELLEEKLIESLQVKEQECIGYVIVTNKDGKDTYKPYIKCGKYKTRGYKENYLS